MVLFIYYVNSTHGYTRKEIGTSPAAIHCPTEQLNITSIWLQNYFILSSPSNFQLLTFVFSVRSWAN